MTDSSNLPTSLLHGVYNLTDLLGELPLAEPAPETLNNQQIIFVPRLADDIRRVLGSDGRNDVNMIGRIGISLGQVDSSSIQISVPCSEGLPPEQSQPPLLRAVVSVNPNAFRGPQLQQTPQISPSRRLPSQSSSSTSQTSVIQPTQHHQQNQQQPVVEKLEPVVRLERLPTNEIPSSSTSKPAPQKLEKPSEPTPRPQPPEEDDDVTIVRIKKKKKKELDQLEQDNRNLAKYDARYPDLHHRQQHLLMEAGLTGEEFLDTEIKKYSDFSTDKKRSKKDEISHAQRDSVSLNVMAEQGLPELAIESDSLDFTDMASTSNEQKPKMKKRKRDKDENERLTVRLQLSLIGGNDDLIENVVYRNFINLMEDIFNNVDDANLHDYFKKADEDAEIPDEAVISRGLLSELVSEASKLCELGATCHIPGENLSRILTVLQWNVRYGGNCQLNKDQPNEESGDNFEREMALFREVSAQRILHSIDSCLAILYILTAPNLPRHLYTDEVIESVVGAVRFQLSNTIFPEFDPLYRADSEGKSYGNLKSKRSRTGHVKDKLVVNMYQKIMLTVDLLANLVGMQDLGDTLLIKLTSIAVSPFFVENISELQLAALRLVVAMFAKHDRIRQFILDDILSSLTKLPSTKRNLRSYRLWNHSGSIQMVTALVLNIVQCMAKLPEIKPDANPVAENPASQQPQQQNGEGDQSSKEASPQGSTDQQQDANQNLQTSYDLAKRIAVLFITAFFKKCTQKSEDDYRPLFENFVQDLLTTAQRPEWPATDLMLSLLGTILTNHFTNRNLDNNIRVAALDYFGQIAARLRRDGTAANVSKETLDSIVDQLKDMDPEYAAIMEKKSCVLFERVVVEVEEEGEIKEGEDEDVPPKRARRGRSSKKPPLRNVQNQSKKSKKLVKRVVLTKKSVDVDENTRLLQLMQKAFSAFVFDASTLDPTLAYSRNFCLTQWHADAITEADRALKIHQNNVKNGLETTTTEQEIQDRCEMQKSFVKGLISLANEQNGSKQKIPVVSHDTACLIALWLGKQRSFAQSFDFFLSNILNLLSETTIAIRTRAMKSLALVVESDPSVLNIAIVRKAVHGCLGDNSTSVREAAVDLIGRFILHNADLTLNYYPLLCERINDVGVSVRKRVLKIFRDICLEQPDFPKIADLCKQMITRIGDEESIRKLVSEAFQHMWFQPLDVAKEPHRLTRRVTSIVDVVSACREIGYDWFHQLLETLLKKSDESVQMTTMETSRQIVDGLMEHTVRCEEVDAENRSSAASSITLVSTLTALSIFCKSAPHLLIHHVQLLHPYLNIKCSTQADYHVIINTCKILELSVPLMANPNPEFVKQLETDLLASSSKQGMAVLESVVACLGAVVNRVTQRYPVVIQCLEKLTASLHSFLTGHRKNPQQEIARQVKAVLLRNLYLIGLLCKNFDFEALSSTNPGSPSVRETIQQYYLYFCVIGDEDIKHKALMGLGFFCTRYFNCLLSDQLKNMYQKFLTDPNNGNPKFKIQVLQNILAGLKEQETNPLDENSQQIAEQTEVQTDHHVQGDLKEMYDIQSGLASNVTQLYLGNILQAYFDTNVDVRSAAADVILLIVAHGLIHPAKCVPYLIAATTDSNPSIRTRAEQRLRDIEKRYPNFISMKALPGARKSFELQQIIQRETGEPIRGLFANFNRDPGAESGSSQDQSPATLSAVYMLLRGNKQHRRVFIVSLIKLFDETSQASLAELVYFADNIVYFPYGSSDEVLQTIFQIEQHISITGTNLIQSVKDMCTSNGGSFAGYMGQGGSQDNYYQQQQQQQQQQVGYPREIPEDEEEFFQAHHLIDILPADLTQVHSLVTTTAQNCLLLLHVKNVLKEQYGLTDAKVRQYVGTCNSRNAQKLYDKPPPRRQTVRYAPPQLENLRSGPVPCPHIGDMRGRQSLVAQLVEFKQLLDSLDQDAVSAAVNDSIGDGDEAMEGMEEDGEGGEGGEEGVEKAAGKKKGANKTPSKRGRGGGAGRGRGGRSATKKGKAKKKEQNSDFEDDLDDWGDLGDTNFDDDEDFRP